jgi:hypothetical protein
MGSVGRFSVKLRADTDRFRTFRRQTKMRYPSRSRQPTTTPTMTKRGRRSSPRGTRLYSRPRSRPGRKPGTILLSALTSDRRTQPGHCSPEPGAECLCAAPPANARSQFHRRLRRALGDLLGDQAVERVLVSEHAGSMVRQRRVRRHYHDVTARFRSRTHSDDRV